MFREFKPGERDGKERPASECKEDESDGLR